MRIAVTGAAGRLGRALAAQATEYELRLSDGQGTDVSAAGRVQVVVGDLREPEVAHRVVEGCGALIHLAAHPESWPPDVPDDEVLDRCARGTFELLRAAVVAGVPRVVLVSSMDLFEAYPRGWAVNETWRPRPSPAMRELGPYMAELSCREFARAGWPLLAVCLRLGRLVDGRETRESAADARSLHVDDAVAAIRRALVFQPAGRRRSEEVGWVAPKHAGWWVFHITGGARARFPLAAAVQPTFGYGPKHVFGGTAADEPRLA